MDSTDFSQRTQPLLFFLAFRSVSFSRTPSQFGPPASDPDGMRSKETSENLVTAFKKIEHSNKNFKKIISGKKIEKVKKNAKKSPEKKHN